MVAASPALRLLRRSTHARVRPLGGGQGSSCLYAQAWGMQYGGDGGDGGDGGYDEHEEENPGQDEHREGVQARMPALQHQHQCQPLLVLAVQWHVESAMPLAELKALASPLSLYATPGVCAVTDGATPGAFHPPL